MHACALILAFQRWNTTKKTLPERTLRLSTLNQWRNQCFVQLKLCTSGLILASEFLTTKLVGHVAFRHSCFRAQVAEPPAKPVHVLFDSSTHMLRICI